MIKKNCLNCSKEFSIYASVIKYGRGKFCSHSCRSSGRFNVKWRGGRRVDKDGYILIHKPNHPSANAQGYVREHRLVMEHFLGRYLKKTEVVHHMNKDTGDNGLVNLELFSSDSEHRTKTMKGEDNPNYRHGRNVMVA